MPIYGLLFGVAASPFFVLGGSSERKSLPLLSSFLHLQKSMCQDIPNMYLKIPQYGHDNDLEMVLYTEINSASK